MKDCIELIRNNAINYPKRIAIIDGERKINYSVFFDMVISISSQLTIKNESPKIIFDLPQGIEAYALIVACLNAGGTYCPLNPDAPLERKLQIIEEFNPDFIVVEPNVNTSHFTSEKTITIDTLLKTNQSSSFSNQHNQESIIYVIYTSGTTGKPKGVMICRKALNKFLEWSIPTYCATEKDIWGQFSFLSFDLSIVDIFTCLCSGATLYSMNDIPAKKNRPAGVIEKEKITIWHSIPSAVEFMMINERFKYYDFSSLRLMSFCGEPLRKHQVEFLFNKNKNLKIFNTYGPTEGTLFCTYQELTRDSYLNYCEFTVSIGKAIPGWNLKLVPFNDSEEKEVLIYGNFIGSGYLGKLNDDKFKRLVINGKEECVFETGDLVTEKKGNIYFSSRKDRQVKIKGYRVELDEIDFRINEYIKKTCVTVVKKDSLYSFVETDNSIDELKLREFLKHKLEPYKIPNAIYTIHEIPRSQNQKVNVTELIKLIP
jgi:D-alanine--poly(phosphoribitol) ligase subunit 1